MNKMIIVYWLLAFAMIHGWCFSKVIEVGRENRSVLDSKQRMIIKFAASWCTTCQSIAEHFEEVSEEGEFAAIIFVRIKIEECEEIARKHGVVGVPTFAYLENGSKKGQLTGAQEVGTFKDNIRASLRHHFDMLPTATLAKVQNNDMLGWLWGGIFHMIDDAAAMIKHLFA